jgi:HTH-type transcriptional regulator / antitoxin HigA
LTQREAASRMGVSQPRIAQIEKAHNLTSEVVQKYARVLGGEVRLTIRPADVAALDARTQEVVRPERSDRSVLAEVRKTFPLSHAMKQGWLPAEPSVQLAASVHQFLSPWEEGYLSVAARKADSQHEFTSHQKAWVCRVLQRSVGRAVDPYDPERLGAFASELKTFEPSQLATVPARLASIGVIAVMEEHLPGTKLDGVAVLREDGVPIVAVTNRRKRFDVLLWTLLHEIAHVWLGHLHRLPIAIDEDLLTSSRSDRELQADERALRWLFPNGFPSIDRTPDTHEIHRLSRVLDVHPSVVAGQILRLNQRADYQRLARFVEHVPLIVW